VKTIRASLIGLVAALLATSLPCAPAETIVTPKLQRIYVTAFAETIHRHATIASDGTTYISTGDIAAEWLRDASATVVPYIGLSVRDPHVAGTLRGALARMAKYILIDPYANAFAKNYSVVEQKFEVDSLLYPVWIAHRYWRETGTASAFTPEMQRAFKRALVVLRTEQHHDARSHYRNSQLANGGRGTPTAFNGMIWTGFRPSDDPARYHYNVPENMFAVVVLRDLAQIEREVYHDPKTAGQAAEFSEEVRRAIERDAIVYVPGVGRIYAYEVDGLGHDNVMDDANVPSLVSTPYFGYVRTSDPIYQATRRFALSNRNPYFYTGKVARGVGSPHTPPGYVWPLGLVMQVLTSDDPTEVQRVLGYLADSDTGDHRLHESFDSNAPRQYTRDDFAWPNALYAEMILKRGGTQPSALQDLR
jgi:meiotically up-regulated gene 157 (Mug157) protein